MSYAFVDSLGFSGTCDRKRGVFSPLYGRIAPRSVRLDAHKFKSIRLSSFQRAEQREEMISPIWRPPHHYLPQKILLLQSRLSQI